MLSAPKIEQTKYLIRNEIIVHIHRLEFYIFCCCFFRLILLFFWSLSQLLMLFAFFNFLFSSHSASVALAHAHMTTMARTHGHSHTHTHTLSRWIYFAALTNPALGRHHPKIEAHNHTLCIQHLYAHLFLMRILCYYLYFSPSFLAMSERRKKTQNILIMTGLSIVCATMVVMNDDDNNNLLLLMTMLMLL